MTIRKIATLANLSPSTVYRALKNPNKAKKEVLDSIKKITNSTTIQERHIQTVYIIFPHANQFYLQLILEMTNLLLEKDIKVIPFITNESEEKEQCFFNSLTFSSKICILWSPTTKTIPFFMKKKKDKPHVILFNRHFDEHYEDMLFSLDNTYASQKATEVLIRYNNKKILYVGGSPNYKTAADREKGFFDIVNANEGVTGDVIHSNFHEWIDTYKAIQTLNISQYDAILCGNEIISYGVIKFLKETKHDIPRNIRLITFDYTSVFDALQISMIYFSPKHISQKITDYIYQNTKSNQKSYVFLPEYIEKGSESNII